MKWIFLLLFCLLFLPHASHAQQLSQHWVCLNVQSCNPKQDSKHVCSGKGTPGHRARLSTKSNAPALANDKNTYIVECVATGKGQVCTSGNSTTDQTIFNHDNVQDLQSQVGYAFQGNFLSPPLGDGVKKADPQNPVPSNSSGNIGPYEWQSKTKKPRDRQFLALNYFDAGSVVVGQGGQQQGSLTFDTNSGPCVSVHWDPFGRMFNSQNLEPISEVRVELDKKRDNGSFTFYNPNEVQGGGLINPYFTEEDGAFSFAVPDGTYKLSPAKAKYTFPNDTSKFPLNSNYTQIYSNIYPNQTGVEIVQQGSIQQRDIPVDALVPQNGSPVKLMEYFYDLDKRTKQLLIQGRVSHPLTTINAWTLKNNLRDRLVATVVADNFGEFTLNIDETSFAPDETFGELEYIKSNLYTQARKDSNVFLSLLNKLQELFIGQAQAQNASSDTLHFDPIPNYLEGYAYDLSGKPIPSAAVSIYLNFSQKPYYQTKADNTGYFKITSEFLPSMPYTITYTNPTGGTQSLTTSQFIAQNQDFINKNNINLNSYKNSQGQDVAFAKTPFAQSQIGKTQNGPNQDQSSTINNQIFLISMILLGLIILVGAGAGFYLYRKNKTTIL